MSAERPPGERGAALLTVLLLVAVIAALAGTALERLRLTTRLAGNAVGIEGARAAGRMAETLALTRINDLLGRDPSRVTLEGGWSGRALPLPLPGGNGLAVARVTDGGNCFNLNGLVAPAGDEGAYVSQPGQRVAFARLMRLLGTPAATADQVAAAAADWIDSDDSQQPGGAEDAAYLRLPQPYRTAGTLMADPSELRAVSGVSADLYTTLRPWLCTLPVAAPVRINVNTLPPERAPLLAALMPEGANAESVRQALLRRPEHGYTGTSDFWSSSALAGVASGDAAGQTATTSTWFALDVTVTGGRAALEQHDLIDATHLPARVAARHWGEAS